MSRKYHILLVIRWPVGGIRTFIRYVYRRFDKSIYKFSIIAPNLEDMKILIDDLSGMEVSYIPFNENISSINLFGLIFKTIFFGKFDLVHSHGFMSGVYSALPARLTRIKHIMTSHDILLPKQFLGLKGYIHKKTLSIFLPMIDVIHSVSYDAHQNLIETLPNLKKFNVKSVTIPNGIEVERFNGSEKRDFRKELNLGYDTFLIGFLGRFMSQKGFIYLVDALELLLKKIDLPKNPVVFAFGWGGFVREDREHINKKGLAPHFHFLPFTPNVAPVLKGLDIVAMPSLWEACSLLAMETMVAGIPLIGTDCIGLREVLKDTPSILVPAGNSQALAKAIEAEMKGPSVSKTEAFKKKASIRFDVKKQAAKLEQLILETLKAK